MWWQELAKTMQRKQDADTASGVLPCRSSDETPEDSAAHEPLDTAFVLQKHDNRILPLSQNTRLAVVGDLSSTAVSIERALDALIECFPSCIGYAPGFPGESMIKSAEVLASEAECVFLILRLNDGPAKSSACCAQQCLSDEQDRLYQRMMTSARKLILILYTSSGLEIYEHITGNDIILTGCGEQIEMDALLHILSGLPR